ncbi:MAG: protein translocase subunit SecD [Elusimicrobia bacterium]|nr:protein translocase subunit SecD [Elusimicrobiota bacterium]
MKNIQTRLTISAVVVGLGLVALMPSVLWYVKSPGIRQELERAKRLPKWLIRLGLDLRGGTHLLMELDVEQLEKQTSNQQTLQDALDRAVEIMRNRVDQFGVGEPFIAKQGDRFIVVQLPGISDPRRAKDIIGKTALLEFRMVEDSASSAEALVKIRDLGDPWDASGVLKEDALKLVPPNTILAKSRDGEGLYLLRSTASMTGSTLINAKVEMGQFSLPHVSIVFNNEGGALFARLTQANVGKNMAIVLDGLVQSAPVIRERISGGRAIIEGNFSMQEARDLALVLRAGALPVPVRIVEERSVGPTLGEDSIRSGVWASIAGTLFVFIFMTIYYRASGTVANFCLLLNVVLTMACLALFNATLTLPGLAGLALTIGMAVDANVLIFERIREELRLGKTVRVCLEQGYERALTAIIDSNVTTLIAAFFLFQFGSGPIKGFAVTLTIGLLSSMFTAVFVSRTLFMMYYENNREAQTISI